MTKKNLTPHHRKDTPVTVEVMIDERPLKIRWPELQEQYSDLLGVVWDCERRARQDLRLN